VPGFVVAGPGNFLGNFLKSFLEIIFWLGKNFGKNSVVNLTDNEGTESRKK
jgi:hypothetical protein